MPPITREAIYAFERGVRPEALPARSATGGTFDSTFLRGVPLGGAVWVTNDAGDLYLFRAHPSEILRELQRILGVTVDGVWGSRTLTAAAQQSGVNSQAIPILSDGQIRTAIERIIARDLVSGGWTLDTVNDPARFRRGLTVVLPRLTEVPAVDVAIGRRTVRVPRVTSDPMTTGHRYWDGSTGPFAPAQAAPVRVADAATPVVDPTPATTTSVTSTTPVVATTAVAAAPPPRAQPTVMARMNAPLMALLGAGLVLGVIWATDRSKKPKDRILRPVKWR